MTIWREFGRDARWFLRQRLVPQVLGIGLMMRLLWSYALPLVNDEAYYWDWGRAPQLSYFDHPPMVGWLSFLAKALPGALSARGLIPFVHLLTAMALGAVLARSQKSDAVKQQACTWLLLLVQLVPFFDLGGCLLLPDAGLGLCISLALYGCLAALQRAETCLRFSDALWIGLWFGLAGTAKYHAAPLAIGLLGALLWQRRSYVMRDLARWVLLCFVGLLVVSPVLIWNYQNDFISFRYQTDHGFGGSDGIHLTPALQTLMAQFLLFTPAYFIAVFGWARSVVGRRERDQVSILSFWMAAPLALILFVTSFFKQTLPHWIVPSFIVCVPSISLYATTLGFGVRKWLRRTVVTLGGFIVIVVNVFSTREARTFLVHDILRDRPGSLGTEFTLWESMGSYFATDEGKAKLVWPGATAALARHCPATPLIASLRWFWTAQMAYHLPGQPKVLNLDPRFLSYYRFRDVAQNIENCPIIVIGSRKHFDPIELESFVTMQETQDLTIAGHLDQPLFIGYGIGRKQPALETASHGSSSQQ